MNANTNEIEPNADATRQIIDVWSNGMVRKLNEVVDTDIIAHLPRYDGSIEGLEAYKDAIRMYRAAFPDLSVADNSLLTYEDTVVTLVTLGGTHEGWYAGYEATENSFELDGIMVWRFDDGRAVESNVCVDRLTILEQLDVLETADEQ